MENSERLKLLTAREWDLFKLYLKHSISVDRSDKYVSYKNVTKRGLGFVEKVIDGFADFEQKIEDRRKTEAEKKQEAEKLRKRTADYYYFSGEGETPKYKDLSEKVAHYIYKSFKHQRQSIFKSQNISPTDDPETKKITLYYDGKPASCLISLLRLLEWERERKEYANLISNMSIMERLENEIPVLYEDLEESKQIELKRQLKDCKTILNRRTDRLWQMIVDKNRCLWWEDAETYPEDHMVEGLWFSFETKDPSSSYRYRNSPVFVTIETLLDLFKEIEQFIESLYPTQRNSYSQIRIEYNKLNDEEKQSVIEYYLDACKSCDNVSYHHELDGFKMVEDGVPYRIWRRILVDLPTWCEWQHKRYQLPNLYSGRPKREYD